MKTIQFVFLLAVILTGCAINQPIQIVQINATFDSDQAKVLMADGNNTIKGSAFMRQRGGGIVTCAGSDVRLIPATDYAKERMRIIYATTGDFGVRRGTAQARLETSVDDYLKYQKLTRCDAQGNFTFENVANGEFFVITTVRWEVSHAAQGGSMMHRVRPSSNSTISVIMSD